MRLLTLIVGILALKAIAIFVALPIVQRSLAHSYGSGFAESYYGIGFADNYYQIGWSLARGYGYRFRPETAPTLMREPGEPLFLAGLFWLFGKSLDAARIANLLLSGIAAWLTYRLAARVFNSKAVALLAALLFLVHPGVFISELRAGVEVIFTVLVLGFFSVLYTALRRDRLRYYLVAGLVLGVASLVRSTALLFPVFLVPLFLLWRSPRPSWPRMCAVVAVVFTGVAVAISPWMLRNWLVAGVPLPTASIQPVAAQIGQYICSNRSLDTRFRDLDYAAADFRLNFARQHGFSFTGGYDMFFYDTRDELAFSNLLASYVLENYRRSPGLFLKCSFSNVFNFWFTGKNWPATTMNLLVQLPYLILGTLGIIITLKSGRGRDAGIFVLFIAYLMLVHMPVHAQARYSVPLIPFLAMFAAVGALQLAGRLQLTRTSNDPAAPGRALESPKS